MTTTSLPVENDAAGYATIQDVLRDGAVRSVFQPIVDMSSGAVVAYEALARGPVGRWESPAALFPAAREAGLLPELDEACRAAAFRGASDLGLTAPLSIFVNVEPEVLDGAPLSDLLAIAEGAPGELRIVVEITERALAARPAELLRTVERVRELGWGVALDDVGAEPASLAFMSLLRPDVVKLDLSLVQGRPGPHVAEIMNAVNSYAERSGALLLAEGIETERHLATARALGAVLGQGWYFGRPSAAPAVPAGVTGLRLPPTPVMSSATASSPFSHLPDDVVLRRAPKRLLVELSKQLEREAMRLGETCVVAATFQYSQHFTVSTAQRYRDLIERVGFVCALGENLPVEPVPGLRGAPLEPHDPIVGEWDVAVLSPHFGAALLARDLGDSGPDMDREFEYALTYQRDVVTRATHELLLRVAPRRSFEPVDPAAGAVAVPAPVVYDPSAVVSASAVANQLVVATGPVDTADALVRRALASTTSGVTITDMTAPDQPIIFVNRAFERLSGLPAAELLGRNCRLLQGIDTDQAAVSRIRAALDAGEECLVQFVNYRGVDQVPWWNELSLSPVRDGSGRVVQYVGVQNDVTKRVEAERALIEERDRARSYLSRIEELAHTDPLTGLMNRRRFEDRFEAALLDSRLDDSTVALLFMDLDGFKAVNDRLGHSAGDALLKVVARRLRARLRGTDLVARLGGDEFVVGLTGLARAVAEAEAQAVARELTELLARPTRLGDADISVTASIGVSASLLGVESFGSMLHEADMRMYALKHPGLTGVDPGFLRG
jgi:diguanylate cyclase (GGDEF)-like protein/PAS domain S-box-containing protein